MPNKLPTVLEGIVASRREHLPAIRARIAQVDVDKLPKSTRSLRDSLGERGSNSFIMECKSASPSLGLIREHYEPGAIASVYSRYAAGISVLCEPERFGGDYDHLATVAATTHLPVLCKDFIIDEAQIYAARYYGADAILLMLSVLDDATYTRLAALAEKLGLDVLTEVIDEVEVMRAIWLGAKIFGVNHRNLHDLSIDLSRSARLAELIPEEAALVAESGIRDHATVRQLSSHSTGFLVGSQLTSQPDVDQAARRLVFGENKVCGLVRPSAAQAARAAGAVYGGLIFEESSRRNVSRETAKNIIAHEPGLNYVAVSRRTTGWGELSDGLDVHAVQIHAPYQGSLAAERALIAQVRREVGERVAVWRAISMTNAPAGLAEELLGVADRLVLDAGEGGSGTTFDWATVPEEVKASSLLAGGITLANLPEALTVGCAGVDLNSGFEYDNQGNKDTGALLRAFQLIRG